MMSDKELKKPRIGLSQSLVQTLSWISLFGMFLVDKVFHMAVPPLPEYWYGVVFGVAAFGKVASIAMLKRRL
jgi:hypothetical protein